MAKKQEETNVGIAALLDMMKKQYQPYNLSCTPFIFAYHVLSLLPNICASDILLSLIQFSLTLMLYLFHIYFAVSDAFNHVFIQSFLTLYSIFVDDKRVSKTCKYLGSKSTN